MKEKKETLSQKIARLERLLAQKDQSNSLLNEQDSAIRINFTKVLGSTRLGGEVYNFSSTSERTLSWEEIFFQVGLISARMFNNEIRNDMNDFQQRISKLESKPESRLRF
jgi:hypothetical protein